MLVVWFFKCVFHFVLSFRSLSRDCFLFFLFDEKHFYLGVHIEQVLFSGNKQQQSATPVHPLGRGQLGPLGCPSCPLSDCDKNCLQEIESAPNFWSLKTPQSAGFFRLILPFHICQNPRFRKKLMTMDPCTKSPIFWSVLFFANGILYAPSNFFFYFFFFQLPWTVDDVQNAMPIVDVKMGFLMIKHGRNPIPLTVLESIDQ